LVEAAVAVGDDVEAGQLLVPQVNRERVYVLLAVARGDHRVEKRPCAEVLGVPTGSRQRSGDRGGESLVGGRLQHEPNLVEARALYPSISSHKAQVTSPRFK